MPVRSMYFYVQYSQDDQELKEIVASGATLLHVDCQVLQWLQWRNKEGLPRLKVHGEYVEVKMDEMDKFYSFKKNHFTSGIVELPAEDLLEYYVQIKKKSFPQLHKYGSKYISMPCSEVDGFCEWINEAREKAYTF